MTYGDRLVGLAFWLSALAFAGSFFVVFIAGALIVSWERLSIPCLSVQTLLMARQGHSLSSWFDKEVKANEPALRAYLQQKVPKDVDVDDVVQEAYLRRRQGDPVRHQRQEDEANPIFKGSALLDSQEHCFRPVSEELRGQDGFFRGIGCWPRLRFP